MLMDEMVHICDTKFADGDCDVIYRPYQDG